jgi:hypothetical protein
MAYSQDECIAAYPRSQVCNDRLYSRLLSWAAYITALPMPPTDTAPDVEWVRQRILAERTPANATYYVPQISPYTLEEPDVATNIRQMLNAYNSEAQETSLVSFIDSALAVVMPKYAAATITDQQVAEWCERNGYPVPPNLDLPSGPGF